MVRNGGRTAVVLVLAGLGVLVLRSIVHAKVPDPEGRWEPVEPGSFAGR